jgi:hypothetical protein
MSGYLKLAYEAPNCTAPNQMALNLIMQCQTKACIAMWDLRFGTTYRSHPKRPRNPKQNRTKIRLKKKILSFYLGWWGGSLSIVRFFKEARHFRNQLFPFLDKAAADLV